VLLAAVFCLFAFTTTLLTLSLDRRPQVRNPCLGAAQHFGGRVSGLFTSRPAAPRETSGEKPCLGRTQPIATETTHQVRGGLKADTEPNQTEFLFGCGCFWGRRWDLAPARCRTTAVFMPAAFADPHYDVAARQKKKPGHTGVRVSLNIERVLHELCSSCSGNARPHPGWPGHDTAAITASAIVDPHADQLNSPSSARHYQGQLHGREVLDKSHGRSWGRPLFFPKPTPQ